MLIAELGLHGFDSFLETDTGFQCSVIESTFIESEISDVLDKYKIRKSVSYRISTIAKTDWNKEWEKNFESILIENKVLISAPFHKNNGIFPYKIIIEPKMSFGTGHHETTYMMIQAMLNLEFKNKRILDAGCGTGILSIMAEKLGAIGIEAIDIDEWAIINSRENIYLNECLKIIITQTSFKDYSGVGNFQIILANINRNTLLEEINLYSNRLSDHGSLVLSGYYDIDNILIEEQARKNNCLKVCQYSRNHWSAIVFEKKTDYFS